MVFACSEQVLAKDLGCGDLCEPSRPVAPERVGELALVHGGAVGGDCDNQVVTAEMKPLCELDRGQDVAPAREAE